MVVVLKRGTGEEEIKQVESLSESLNLSCHVSRGLERVVIGVIGDDRYMSVERFEALECVEQVVRVSSLLSSYRESFTVKISQWRSGICLLEKASS